MSGREQRRSLLGGSDGFTRIPDNHDATMSIPLTQVKSTGQRSVEQSTGGYDTEKSGGIYGNQRGARSRSMVLLNKKDEEEGNPLTLMGKVYDKIFHFSVVTRYILYILPLSIILAVPIVISSTVAPNADIGPANEDPKKKVKLRWLFLWIQVVWVSLWVGKLFAKALPSIFRTLAGTVSPGVRKYSIAIKRLELPIALVGWAVTSLATFYPIITQNPQRRADRTNSPIAWESTMQNVLAAGVVSSLVFLGEKVFIVMVSVQYHQQTFDRKIKKSKRNIDLVSQLLDASHALFPPYCPEFAEEDYTINDSFGLATGSGKNTKGRSGIATPMKFLHNVGRVGDKITAAFGKVAHEVTGKASFNVTASHSITVEALEKKKSSEALARRIWMSLVVEGKEALYQEDVLEVLTDLGRPEEEAVETFAAIDKDGNGDVTLDEMIMTVCELGRERKAIANSLHSIDSCITALDRMLLVMVFFGVVFIFIAFMNQSFVGLLATAGTALLSLSFVFSSTITEIFSSCIFLFVKHPFDVDDNVKISDSQLIVMRISLLYTVFKDVKTHTITQCPNSTLNSVWIENISRSHKQREQLLIYISFDTTLEDVELLRRELNHFVSEKDNSRDFDGIEVEVTGIAEMNKLELSVEVQYKSNWQNETLRAARRSKFMCALVLALRKVPINAPGGGFAALGSADAPSYSVAVSDEEAASARKAFKDNQAAAHMNAKPKSPTIDIPHLSFNDEGLSTGREHTGGNDPNLRNRTNLGPASEASAIANLTARSPAADASRDWDDDKRKGPLSPQREDSSPMSPTEIDEVYNILRRKSTRGKRQSPLIGADKYAYSDASSSVPRLPQHPPEAASAGISQMPSGSPPRSRPPQISPGQFGNSEAVTFPAPPNNSNYGASLSSQRPPVSGPRYELPPAPGVGTDAPRLLNPGERKSPSPPAGGPRYYE